MMADFDSYVTSLSDPEKREKARLWQASIGLQAVDGLKPSNFLIQVAQRHIEGEITIQEASRIIDSHYEAK